MLLDVMRRGSNSVFGKILFSILLLASVFGLALGYNTASTGMGSDTVATIAKQSISAQDFDRTVRMDLTGSKLTPVTAYQDGTVEKILQSVVRDRLVRRAADDLGIRPGDAEVRTELQRNMAPYVTPDRPASALLQELLQQRGISEAQLAEQLRDQTAGRILQGAIQSGTSLVSDGETADLYRFAAEEKTIRYVFLPDSAITDYKVPTDAVLLPFYKIGKERFSVPETRRFSLVLITASEPASAISDADLQKAYQEDITKYQEPEKRRMIQAVLKSQAEAQSVVNKIKTGTDLEAAVKAVTGKNSAYLGMQDFAKDGLAPEIAGPAFAASKGALIGPVHTGLGWHVLQLVEILPPVVRPFAAVKDTLRAEVQKNQASDALFARATRIDDAVSGGASLDDAAKKENLSVQKFGAMQADGTTASGQALPASLAADAPAIIKAVFQTNEGETSPSFELKNGSYAVARVDAVTAKSYKPFADVKGTLAKLWIADQQNVINGDHAHDAVTALDNKTKTLEQVAADNHVAVKALTFKRTAAPPPLTPTAAQKFMGLHNGQHAGASAAGGFIVGEVESGRLPPDPAAADLAGIKAREPEQTTQRYAVEYLDYLRTRYGVQINQSVIGKMYGNATPSAAPAQ